MERVTAKCEVLHAKLTKKGRESEELRSDLVAQSKLVVEAEERLAKTHITLQRKDNVVDKAAVDSGSRLRTLKDAEAEIRELHKEIDRHDVDLAERDAKVDQVRLPLSGRPRRLRSEGCPRLRAAPRGRPSPPSPARGRRRAPPSSTSR